MKRWYVLQVYAGYEERVKKDIESFIEKKGLQELFGEILIPSAKQKAFLNVLDSDADREQLFPGYALIEVELTPESMQLVLSSPRVIRFLGGNKPIPVTRREIERIMSQVRGEIKIGAEREEFNVGQEVEIAEGPFVGFVGIIDKVDRGNEKLTVMVSIFGRMTPVELSFRQVKQ